MKKMKKKKEMIKMKETSENQAEELVELIKAQNSELNTLAANLNKSEKENLTLKNTNFKYRNQIDNLLNCTQELKDNLNEFKAIESRVKESENLIIDFQTMCENEKNKNKELTELLEKLNEKYEELVKKYSGENSLEYLQNTIQNLNEEIIIFTKQNEQLKEIIKSKENSLKDLENEILAYVNYSNNFYTTCTKWTDTYLGIYISNEKNNINIPNLIQIAKELPSCNSKFFNNKIKINFEKFAEILMKVRDRLNKDLEFFEESLNEKRNETTTLNDKFECLLKDNSNYKNEIFKFNEENANLKFLNENYKKDVENFKENLSKEQRKFKEIENSNKIFIENLLMELKANFDNIKNNPKLSNYSDFIFKHLYSENMV